MSLEDIEKEYCSLIDDANELLEKNDMKISDALVLELFNLTKKEDENE